MNDFTLPDNHTSRVDITNNQNNITHSLECECSQCFDISHNDTVVAELERYSDELLNYAIKNFDTKHVNEIYIICVKINEMRRYLINMKLPKKHKLWIKNAIYNGTKDIIL